MIIVVPGNPIAKKRPKFFVRKLPKGKIMTGAQNTQVTEEGKFQNIALSQINQKFDGPIYLKCNFHMPTPKGTSKKKIAEIEGATIPHIKRPDLDNLVKFVKDCLTGLVWKDDSQISELSAIKFYSVDPRTEIIIDNFI